MNNAPIGVFDSGVGGLSCVEELMRLMPNEDIVYLGDTARVPYGTRSRDTIIEYAKEDIAFLKRHVSNPHVKIVPLTGLVYSGEDSGRFESWKKGESVPLYVNITIMAEYVSLNLGFTELYLYGVEHTFFDGLGVDDDNRLFIQDKHFYGSEKRYITSSSRKEWHIKDWMYDKYLTFREHELMQGYAEYLGATIINCTRNSLIDAYPRLSKIKKS